MYDLEIESSSEFIAKSQSFDIFCKISLHCGYGSLDNNLQKKRSLFSQKESDFVIDLCVHSFSYIQMIPGQGGVHGAPICI